MRGEASGVVCANRARVPSTTFERPARSHLRARSSPAPPPSVLHTPLYSTPDREVRQMEVTASLLLDTPEVCTCTRFHTPLAENSSPRARTRYDTKMGFRPVVQSGMMRKPGWMVCRQAVVFRRGGEAGQGVAVVERRGGNKTGRVTWPACEQQAQLKLCCRGRMPAPTATGPCWPCERARQLSCSH